MKNPQLLSNLYETWWKYLSLKVLYVPKISAWLNQNCGFLSRDKFLASANNFGTPSTFLLMWSALPPSKEKKSKAWPFFSFVKAFATVVVCFLIYVRKELHWRPLYYTKGWREKNFVLAKLWKTYVQTFINYHTFTFPIKHFLSLNLYSGSKCTKAFSFEV